MHKKDNYNEVYQQLIQQGFMSDIGNGVINGVKKLGGLFSKGSKAIKKHYVNKKLNTNLQKIIATSNNTILKCTDNIKNINTELKSNQNNKKEYLQQINEQIETINNQFKQNQFLASNSISNITNNLQNSLVKQLLEKIQDFGKQTTQFFQTLQPNANIFGKISNFKQQQRTLLFNTLQNEFLTSTISEASLEEVYLEILNEETDTITINNSLNNNYSLTSGQIPTNAKPTQKQQQQQQFQKQADTNDLSLINKKIYMLQRKIQVYKSLYLQPLISIDDIKNEKDLLKILKNVNKKCTLQLTIESFTQLINNFYLSGLLKAYKPISEIKG